MTFRRLNFLGHFIETEEMAVDACDQHIDSGEGVFVFSLVEVELPQSTALWEL